MHFFKTVWVIIFISSINFCEIRSLPAHLIVRDNSTSNEESLSIWCITRPVIHKINYKWTIDRFDFYEAEGGYLESPRFAADSNNKLQWFLALKPNGETNTNNTISVTFFMDFENEEQEAQAQFNISILNIQQKEENLYQSIPQKFTNGDSWDWPNFIKKDEYFRKQLLPNNKLTIFCNVAYTTVSNNTMGNNVLHVCNTTAFETINIPNNFTLDNLAVLYESKELTDIKFRVNDTEYSAHKAILAASSSYFGDMLKNHVDDGRPIEITDTKAQVFGEILRFIYTGKSENVEKLADGLLIASDRYKLNGLKVISSQALLKTLSVENAANVLVLADSVDEFELKYKVIDFITTKPKEILKTTAWIRVATSKPHLVNDITEALSRKLATILANH